MVVATGFFDGVHLGHREVIRQLVSAAESRGTESIVVSFWPHPRNVLQNGARELRLLTSLSEKIEMLRSLGVDRVEILDFSKEFSRLTTEEYLRQYVIGRFGANAILLGYDNRMGSDAASSDEVASVAGRLGLEVIVAKRVDDGDEAISSTKIRRALGCGDVAQVAQMLGYPYMLHGVVVAGNRIGRTIGFPTANMCLYEPLKAIPVNGVYKVEVETLGRKFPGLCNIGVRPTIGIDNLPTVETYILGFDEDIYGLDIKVSFLRKIRDEIKFPSLEELKKQLEKDRNSLYL